MRRAIVRIFLAAVSLFAATGTDSLLSAADGKLYAFEVREPAGIRRRNDVITIRTSNAEIIRHRGGFRVSATGKSIPAQARIVECPGEPRELVVDFIDHFQPFEARRYFLELSNDPAADEPTAGLKLIETAEHFQIDSSGLVFWRIRKDLAGLLEFSWKGTDYIADESIGLYFSADDHHRTSISERTPSHAAVERSGPIAVGLRFDYDDWPPGARSMVRLEFPRTKSWIHAIWTVDKPVAQARFIGAELNLQLEGPEALLDFGAGDFVYTTVTRDQSAVLDAGPRTDSNIPWVVWHGAEGSEDLDLIVSAPRNTLTPKVHGWAHVMDDKRCTALAISRFGETEADSIEAHGDGRLKWQRNYSTNSAAQVRQLEFWLHFVTMPVHIGARTSPRSMQEPLVVNWLDQ